MHDLCHNLTQVSTVSKVTPQHPLLELHFAHLDISINSTNTQPSISTLFYSLFVSPFPWNFAQIAFPIVILDDLTWGCSLTTWNVFPTLSWAANVLQIRIAVFLWQLLQTAKLLLAHNTSKPCVDFNLFYKHPLPLLKVLFALKW